jgi:hypothetical protein
VRGGADHLLWATLKDVAVGGERSVAVACSVGYACSLLFYRLLKAKVLSLSLVGGCDRIQA